MENFGLANFHVYNIVALSLSTKFFYYTDCLVFQIIFLLFEQLHDKNLCIH